MFRALGNRNYRLWASADLVSVTGSWMQVLGLNWLVLARTGSATSVGISVLLSTLPALLLGPWAGALADRFPPRRIILLGETAHLLIALLLAAMVWADLPLPAIYALTALSGLVGTFEGPALGRFAGQVVPRADLGNALALNSIINSAGRVLGMSVAGVLAATAGELPLFLCNAASFLAVIATILVMRRDELHPLAVSPPDRAGVRPGLAYLRGHRLLLILFALGFVLSGLGRNYQVTMAAMTQGPLGTGAAGYGVLSSVFAVGTVLGGLVAARARELTMPLLLGAAAVTSVLQAVSGFVPGMLGFAAMILPIAAGAVLIDTIKSTRVQLDAVEDMRARMLSVEGAVAAAAGAVGAPLLGWLCDGLGPRPALLLAGLTTLVATSVAALALRPPRPATAAEPVPLAVAPVAAA
ncbi:Predicted arabinose efflux permease, MFS family [Amycolatopsis arida]|uniref:Predicted arabinose efflux permease, MFS family n=1 Tax=Amycolatopsis arida TaxID=587909 RepID=A0A1I5R0X9_9PSEU|nr:MFS transporter [Amycolatopsis arida]TDX99033.1 putative MFS family arabinose efflux permease [Amycolatopsis arida]SFP52143.1 Predicted arabinose efflux permease, MFS family [Amycolatopsis arida]